MGSVKLAVGDGVDIEVKTEAQLNSEINRYQTNLATIRSLQDAIVERWGTARRDRMRQDRGRLTKENLQIDVAISKYFQKRWGIPDDRSTDEIKTAWKNVIAEAILLHTNYKEKLEDQLLRLLRSLNVLSTREQVQNFNKDDIESLRLENHIDGDKENSSDWKQVDHRMEEIKELEKYIQYIKDELMNLEISKKYEGDEDEEKDIEESTRENSTFLQSYTKQLVDLTQPLENRLEKLSGKQWKLVMSIFVATILGLLIIIIYGLTTYNNESEPQQEEQSIESTTPCVPSSPSDICPFDE